MKFLLEPNSKGTYYRVDYSKICGIHTHKCPYKLTMC